MNKFFCYLQLARLDKPIGILLLLWPTLWGLWLAKQGTPNIKLLIIFILGTIATRSAGCVINDIFDRHFDRQVRRTRNRPLATRQLSLTQAMLFLFLLSSISLFLLLQLNRLSILLGLLAAFIAAVYPLMKRITYFPQVIQGTAFSMGILIAFSATLNHLSLTCLLLFLLNIIWGVAYDTTYALCDMADDLKIGVKSTAVFFKQRSGLFIAILQTFFTIGLIAVGLQEQLKLSFYLALLLIIFLFIYQHYLLKQHKPFAAFLNNQWVGLVIWLGIVFSFSITMS